MMALQIYDAGIKTNTKYLTPELAYFLGGIYAADESVPTEDKLYWAAPVRHNSKYATSTQITEHFDFVSEISGKVGGYIQMKESIIGTALDSGKNKTLLGFSTFFESTGLTDLCAEIPNLKTVLFNSDQDVKTAFIEVARFPSWFVECWRTASVTMLSETGSLFIAANSSADADALFIERGVSIYLFEQDRRSVSLPPNSFCQNSTRSFAVSIGSSIESCSAGVSSNDPSFSGVSQNTNLNSPDMVFAASQILSAREVFL